MRFARALGIGIAVAAICLDGNAAQAFNPNPPQDPRAVGVAPIRAWSRGTEIIRLERAPDGTPRRCVRAANLATPADGGPSRLEFGVERPTPNSPDVTMFFRVQYLDAPTGKPLAVRDPVFQIDYFGPTTDWRLETQPGGWFRRSKSVAASSPDEQLAFINEAKNTGNEIVATFPDGTHRVHLLRGSVSPWHFEIYGTCTCRLADGMSPEMRQFLMCRDPK